MVLGGLHPHRFDSLLFLNESPQFCEVLITEPILVVFWRLHQWDGLRLLVLVRQLGLFEGVVPACGVTDRPGVKPLFRSIVDVSLLQVNDEHRETYWEDEPSDVEVGCLAFGF